MSDLTGLNMDANVKEQTGSFAILPAGKYKAVLLKDELADNSNKNGKILHLYFEIIEGEHIGASVRDLLNIKNLSQVAEQIGQGTLKRICSIFNIPFPPDNLNAIIGKPLAITVKVEEYMNKTTGQPGKTNRITKYDAVTQTDRVETKKDSAWD